MINMSLIETNMEKGKYERRKVERRKRKVERGIKGKKERNGKRKENIYILYINIYTK